MLLPNESIGLREILYDIDDEEIFSLLETVTKRMFTTPHRQEAIEKIVSCTGRPSDLLRRQKITKKILFNYLIKKGAIVLAEWGKPALVKKCLEIWGSTERCKDSDFVEEDNGKKSTEATNVLGVELCKTVENSVMGVEFSKWFFRILNTLDGFGPEHFWPNCNLSAELYTPSDQKQVSLCGSSDVATFLANLIIIDQFHFSANDSKESIMIELEQHGLVKIMIRGVLHQHSSCVGLFDSAFGLVKSPSNENTYKIQLIKVKMQVNCPTQRILPTSSCMSICQSA